MASADESQYDVRRVQESVWETIFDVLPTEEKERTKEQTRRRKFKEKLLEKHREELIIDSSHVTSEGHQGKTYTNTLLATDELELWQHIIEQLYGETYLQTNSELSGGHKILFKKTSGEKFLSFSFYPAKEKMMVQGNDDDLHTWISNYVSLIKQKYNNTDVSDADHHEQVVHAHQATEDGKPRQENNQDSELEVVHTMGDDETNNTLIHKPTPHEKNTKDTNEPSTVHGTQGAEPLTRGDTEADNHDVSNQVIQSATEVPGCDKISTITETSSIGATDKTPGITDSKPVDVTGDFDVHLPAVCNQPVISPSMNLTGGTMDDIESPLFTSEKNTKTYASRRRKSNFFAVKKLAAARDSTNTFCMLRVKQRLDTMDAIINGLQGGILDLVNSVENHTSGTETRVRESSEKLTSLLKETLNKMEKRGVPADNKAIMDTLQNCQSKLSTLSERLTVIESSIPQLKRMGKIELMLENLTAQQQSDGNQHSTPCKCRCVSEITALNENLEDIKQKAAESSETVVSVRQSVTRLEETCSRMNAEIMKGGHWSDAVDFIQKLSGHSQTTQNVKETQMGPVKSHGAAPQPLTSQVKETILKSSSQGATVANHTQSRHEQQQERRSQKSAANLGQTHNSEPRKVLLVGDSTTKGIDKRNLLRQETISMCRAATVAEAYRKINTNSEQKKSKVIFCVGLNDLRQGTEVGEIVQDMRALVEETLYRHPKCYIYLCSILPVNTPEVNRHKIMQLNTAFEKLENVWESVFYVNSMAAFMHDDTPWALFERDHIHPNQRGATLLMHTIRKKIESQNKSFRVFTSKPATPSTFSYLDSLCHNIADSTVHKSAGKPNETHEMQLAGSTVPRTDSLQNNTSVTSPRSRRTPALQSHLDRVDEHARYITQRQCAPDPEHPYPRFHPELRPHRVPWRGYLPYQQTLFPTGLYPREMPEMFNYYV